MRAIGDPAQCLFDRKIVLGIEGVKEIIHIGIAGDVLARRRWPIVLLASRLRNSAIGIALRRSACQCERRLSHRRGAIRIVPITKFQLGKRLLTTVHTRLPCFGDAGFCFQILFDLDAQLTHGARYFLPGVRIWGHSGKRILLMCLGLKKRPARIGRALGHISGAASGRHVQR
ncbi:hypothetical protein CFBP2533_15440 [Xanthomonas hortorum pv. pelargonii]|uniref:Uncharacterized protein n=1 Tax=Xanthomonas hortorum pv. pelargonii TaxID=453602 RepID=A0A6V7CP61_9XANT|nr:hypothetical protein CFBP2533_15440 [Xanthomonas hortorum pv. pelargonii]CAD0320083.1 hypothetical protein CFBP2533_15440 [Xanthomonas hortorum pv. pelargonii]